MLEIWIEIKWLDELKNKLNPKKWRKAIHRWIIRVLIFLEWKAIPETPIRTWYLRKWYKQKAKNEVWVLYNDVEYAPYVHFWTRKQKANPFLERVVKKHWKKTWKILNKQFLDLLNTL